MAGKQATIRVLKLGLARSEEAVHAKWIRAVAEHVKQKSLVLKIEPAIEAAILKECVFRSNSDTCSGPIRTPVLIESGQSFRFNSDICSGFIRTAIPE